MEAKKAYEGMPAYEAGKRDGRLEVICQIYEEYVPTVMNMLALIIETTEDDADKELACDAYNYINGIMFNELPEVYVDDYLKEMKTSIELPEEK